jgi:RNA polymerase sigma-70 factor, ECF subfamily
LGAISGPAMRDLERVLKPHSSRRDATRAAECESSARVAHKEDMSPISPAELEAAYQDHADAVYRQARLILRNPTDARDVIQSSFEKAFAHRERFDATKSVRAWLLGIASHEALHLARRNRIRAWLPFSGRESVEQASSSIVWDAVARLPAGHRAVIGLFYLYGYSSLEVAAILGIPVGTVGSRLLNARKTLRAALADQPMEVIA